RQLGEERARGVGQLDLVGAGRGEGEHGPAEPVAFARLRLAQVAERAKRLAQVMGGAGVDVEGAADLDQADAVVVSGHFLEDAEGAFEGLDAAAALAVSAHGKCLFAHLESSRGVVSPSAAMDADLSFLIMSEYYMQLFLHC